VNISLLGTSGQASFSDVSPGNYRLRIFAKNSNYDTLVVIRVISVPDTSYGCAVNLINDGVTVSDGGATIQFTGVGDMSAFTCFLDGEFYTDEYTTHRSTGERSPRPLERRTTAKRKPPN
jgi:hypothetical protein